MVPTKKKRQRDPPKTLENNLVPKIIETEAQIDAKVPLNKNDGTQKKLDCKQQPKNIFKRHPVRAILLAVLILLMLCLIVIIYRAIQKNKRDYVIVGDHEKISRIDKKSGANITLLEAEGIVAVEYDAITNCTFSHNKHTYIIKRNCGKDDGTDLVHGIKRHNSSLAYDWMSQTLYFTDHQKIKFVKIKKIYADKEKRAKTVVTGNRPDKWEASNLIVHPERGLLFWIERAGGTNRGLIKRSRLDGEAVVTLIPETDIRALHLDYATNRLHWLHPTSNLSRSCNLEGKEERPEEAWLGLLDYAGRYCGPTDKCTIDLYCLLIICVCVFVLNKFYCSFSAECVTDITDIKEIAYAERSKGNLCSDGHRCQGTICVGAPFGEPSCLCPDDTERDSGQCMGSTNIDDAARGAFRWFLDLF